MTNFSGYNVWNDGENIYYSYGTTQCLYKIEQKIIIGQRGTFRIALADSILSDKADKENTVLINTLSLNRKANTTVGTYSVAVGYDVTASNSYSHAEGSSTTASGSASHAEGYSTAASGQNSHAEGSNTTASGSQAHAEGYSTKATGGNSHAEGGYTQGVGNYSHAEGYSSSNSSTSYGARGKADHVEGYNTLANSGSSSSYYGAHAEGNQTKATNHAAHAEGYQTTASGMYSHAEGYYSTASGDYSHAEGYRSTASNHYSHAEGSYTNANGQYSHAEGDYTTASGIYSHAEGNNTFASEGNMFGQHVFGRYNIKFIPETVTITDDIAEQWVPYKKYYYYDCVLKNTVDGVTTYYVPHADIPEYIEPIYDYQSSFWHSYSLPSGTDPSTIAEWDKDTLYPANSIVKEKNTDGEYYYYQNHNAITTTYYPLTGSMYHTQSLNSQFTKYSRIVEIVGNGYYSAKSNARALDIEGNEYLAGDIYVGCNPDSTGGTKLEPLPAVTSSDNGKVFEVLNGAWAIGSEKLDKNYTCFLDGSASLKTWYGLTSFDGRYTWTDGDNIYYSYSSNHYVLDKSTSTWTTKSWTGLTSFVGEHIWTDGDNIYYSDSSAQYVLDKFTSTWSTKTWSGITYLYGQAIWTDGENTYFSDGATQYVLDKSTSTWSSKSWSGLTSFYGYLIWTDGENVYYSSGSNQYILDRSTSTWSTKTWSGLTSFDGINVWSDGNYVYYSGPTSQYVLNTSTSTWTEKVWTGLTSFTGLNTWTDGTNYYFSTGTNHFVFNDEAQLLLGQSGTFNPVAVSSVIPGVMTGATSSTAGTSGLVPAPSAGDDGKYLRGDGTWSGVNALPDVTASDNGKALGVIGGEWVPTDTYAPKAGPVFTESISLGRKANTTVGANSVAVGADGTASGYQAFAVGYNTTASGNQSVAEGYGTTASSAQAHSEGYGATASGAYSHAEGYNTVASGEASHAEGGTTTASATRAHAEGDSTKATNSYSHAEGMGGTYTKNGTTYTSEAKGVADHTEGFQTRTASSMPGNHAEGYQTSATGGAAHAEGYSTLASGNSSHAEGYNTTASGMYSHAEGNGSTASDYYSHAEGYSSTASSGYAHAEGSSTTASGSASHAEGNNTIACTKALGSDSHAEGYNTTASGSRSHAEGTNTIARGMCEHVSGSYNVADRATAWVASTSYTVGDIVSIDETYTDGSNVERTVTKIYKCKTANSDSKFTASKWDEYGKYLEVVGNGTDDASRSNARALDWSGNEYLKGDLYIGCSANSSGGTKVATLTDISSKMDASLKGTANGVAELDVNGKVPSSQLPSYVDDVIEGYYHDGHFYEESTYTTEIVGEAGKIYIDLATDKTYRWGGSTFVVIASDLALGETSSTAYRGDRGKIAYDHATDSNRLTTAQNSGLYKIATTAEGHIASVDTVLKSDITDLGIPAQDTTYSNMTGATSSAAGAAGLVPAPSAGDEDKFLAGDGTWASGGKPMVILSYGNSTWNDFINAYNNNVIVYCRASSNSNPATGSQTRMAFMAYIDNATNPTNVEFQYYRSVSSHSASQMGDQVFVYKLTSSGTWTVTTREASLKQITAGTGINVSWANNVATISGAYSAFTGADGTDAGTTGLVPAPTATDNNKYLKGDGTWASVGSSLPTAPSSDGTYFLQCTVSSGVASYSWVSIPAASGVSF